MQIHRNIFMNVLHIFRYSSNNFALVDMSIRMRYSVIINVTQPS